MLDLSVYRDRYLFRGGVITDALWTVGSNEIFEQDAQPEFMKRVGLKPEHKFLDLGCGCLRGSAKLVDYLDDGNFYGTDISEGLIATIPKRLELLGITKKPTIKILNDYNLVEMFWQKFDYILSVSLLTHLYPEVIPALFKGVSQALKPSGVYYFTMYPTNKPIYDGDIERAQFNIDWLIRTGAENGLKVEDIPGDYPNPSPVPELNLIDRVNTPEMAQWVMKATLL